MRTRLAILIAAGSAALGGCAYGVGGYGSPLGGLSVGVGYGSGYGGYGRYGGYYDPFCHPYGYGLGGIGYRYGGYGGYGYPYGGYRGYPYGGYGGYGGYGSSCLAPYWGWYDGFYYPGTGFYVYDSYRRPFRWTDAQRRYWTLRRQKAETVVNDRSQTLRPNWEDFSRQQADRRAARIEDRAERRADRVQRVQTRSDDRQVQRSTRSSTRATASERRAERQSAREARRRARDD